MFGYYRKSYRGLLCKLKALEANSDNIQDLQHIQDELFSRIKYIEKRIRQCRGETKDLKHKLHHRRSNRHGSKALKELIAKLSFKIREYKWLLYVFRLIGDGLVHIYFSKWDVKPLAYHQSSGFITGKKGLSLERKIVKYTNNKGIPTIQVDLTNCLRYGDICFPMNGLPRLVEVKSSKYNNARTRRQIEDIKRMQEYLFTDKASGIYGSNHLRRVALHSEEQNHIEDLNTVINQAIANGHGYIQPENGLHYIAMREMHEPTLENIVTHTKKPMVFFLNEIKNCRG